MSLLDDFCFVFDKKSNISYSLFYNVLNRKNTFELFFPSKHRTSTLGKIWNKRFRKYFVGWIRKDHGRKYYGKIVIFTNESLMHISNSLLKKIKKHSKATVLFFIDEFFNDYRTVKRAKKILYQNQKYFDLVYTFTPNDVKKYGLRLNESYYSKFDVHAGKERSDIFFIGNLHYFRQSGIGEKIDVIHPCFV